MAGENVFKRLHADSDKDEDLVGLMEHLNLPPKVIKFIRENKKIIISAIVLLVAVALCWSIYDVIRKEKINSASSSLAIALRAPESSRQPVLQKVITDYPGTTSARWARVELANIDLKNGKFKAAAEQYGKIKREIEPANPIFGLVCYGLAQAREAGKEYDLAFNEYQGLSKIDGYQGIGFLGMARIYEIKGEKDKALSVYQQYMATVAGQNTNDPERAFVSEKIGRLKTRP